MCPHLDKHGQRCVKNPSPLGYCNFETQQFKDRTNTISFHSFFTHTINKTYEKKTVCDKFPNAFEL